MHLSLLNGGKVTIFNKTRGSNMSDMFAYFPGEVNCEHELLMP